MNRREFVRGVSALAAACAAGCTRTAPDDASLATGARDCSWLPAGVQLFTVRERLQQDPRSAFAALREIGTVEAELYGLSGDASATVLGLPPSELKAIVDDAGIAVTFSHIDGSLANTAAVAELAHALGVETVVVALPTEFTALRDGRFAMVPAASKAQLDALAEKLNRVGREYRALGLQFAYHNHHVEFMPVEGVIPYDYLMSATDPDLVKIELDLGWLAASGRDPVAELERRAGRVVACHMKDFDGTIETEVPQQQLVEPGSGSVDFAAVLAAMRSTNVIRGFIEIDVTSDPLGAIGRGMRHLERIQGCA